MTEWIVAALLLTGAALGMIAAIGVLRMPDLFTRMQASTKCGTLGVGCMVAAVSVHFGVIEVTAPAMLIIAFLFLTAPVAAHMIARAAYFVGSPQWEGTVIDELRGCYDQRTHALSSPEESFSSAPSPGDRSL